MLLDDGRVVSNFIVQALRGAPLAIYGDGTQTRSFCYIDDMIGGLIRLLESPRSITGPINLGNPEEISMQELARQVLLLTSSSSAFEYVPLPGDDPVQRQPAITRACEQLGWTPGIALEEGLQRTIDYFSRQLETR